MSAEDASAAAATGEGTDSTDGWTKAKPRRHGADKPKFIICMDQARRRRQPNHRALMMATQPQAAAQPLFPGCESDSESDSEPDDDDDDADASGRRCPKFVLADVQCLLSYLLLTYRCLQHPRWCRVVKPNNVPRILLVIFDSAGPSAAAKLPTFLASFYQAMRLMSPYSYADTLGPELFSLPLQSVVLGDRQLLLNWLQKRAPKSGIAASVEGTKRTAPPDVKIGTLVEPPEKPVAFPERDNFPRTMLLLSSVQLLHENYPMPGLRGGSASSDDYRTSLPAYRPASPTSPMFGLDCEMVVTEGPQGSSSSAQQQLELARATLIDEAGQVLLDQLVKPANPVLNYLTAKSGITREILDGATVTLAEVQDQLTKLLPPDAILVGHSLNCDLHALRLYHPNCIDTSVIFNLSGNRRHKASLKSLAQRFLGRDIQSDDIVGHSSAEDALAALNLVQLKLSRSLEFGDAASGDWNPSSTVVTADSANADDKSAGPSSKRPRVEASTTSTTASTHFHASLRRGQVDDQASSASASSTVSLFDWMRMHGASFRVFDRQPDRGEYLTALPSAYLVADTPDDVAAVEAAHAEVKCSRLVVLRLRDLESAPAGAAADLASLDAPLSRLYESLPQHSICIALFPGMRPASASPAASSSTQQGAASVARCYFSMRGMSKPQFVGKKN